MIRVVVVDDHAVVRRGLSDLLATADGVEVVGTAGDGAEAAAVVARVRPDVVLMDLSMPERDGVAATAEITASGDVRVVVLTSFSDQKRILDALDAGAVGYLLKDAEPDEIVRAVRSAAAGDAPLSPRAVRVILDARRRPDNDAGRLTDREREVLELVAAGLANKVVARRLGITEKTVKTHLSSVYARIGVSDRTQAALWARDHGLGRSST